MARTGTTGATDRDARITHDLIAETLDGASEATLAAILATGATVREFEEAVALAAGATDVMAEVRRPTTPRVAAIYDILVSLEREEPEDRC